jgi:hypothetical protein
MNCDFMVSEIGVHFSDLTLGHMAADTIFLPYRTSGAKMVGYCS